MAETSGTSLSQMNQETALAQDALRDEQPQGAPDPAVDRTHEERDVNSKRIALFALTMGLLGIGMHMSLWLLLAHFTHTPVPPDASISPLALQPPTPIAPRIEEATPENYRRFLETEERILHSAGPMPLSTSLPALADPGPGVEGTQGAETPTGTTRIPLEDAENALLTRGFANRPQTTPAEEDGSEAPQRSIQPAGAYRPDEGTEGKRP